MFKGSAQRCAAQRVRDMCAKSGAVYSSVCVNLRTRLRVAQSQRVRAN